MALRDAHESIDGLIRCAPGTVGLLIKDANAGEVIQWAPEEPFPAASVIKVPVLVEALRQVGEGTLRLDERIAFSAGDKVGGFGILKELESVGGLSLLDLLTLMIVISDNTAANLCIERVGIDRVNASMASLGLRGTVLQRKMMDMAARERGLDNFTTPSDMALLLECLVAGCVLTPGLCELALSILRRQQVRDRIPFLLPQGVGVAHKTGELPGIRHDVGVVFTGRGPLIVAALTKDFTTPLGQGLAGGEASTLIAEAARLAYSSIMGA